MMADHKLVQVNSRFRSTGTTADFSIDFLSRDLDKVTRVVMIKASLPRLFPNIWSVNNSIVINHAGADFTFLVPEGQYTVITLATAMTTACAGINMAFVYNTTTNRFTATYSGVTTATLVSSSSTIAPYIGLTADLTLGAPADLASPPQLSGPDEVYIHSQIVAANSCVVPSGAIPFLGYISFTTVPYGFVGSYKADSLDVAHIEMPYQVCIRKINIKLCDVNGDLISIPDNCYLDMLLQFSIES